MPKGVYPRKPRSAAIRALYAKHGDCPGDHAKRKPEYIAWRSMKARCYLASRADFQRYGGRGIAVCERWRHDYSAFLADMGPKPTPTHTLDRIDTDGNYEPQNCRWATPRQQVSNRSNSRKATIGGETLTLREWADRKGIPYNTLYARIRRLGSVERAVLHQFGMPLQVEE